MDEIINNQLIRHLLHIGIIMDALERSNYEYVSDVIVQELRVAAQTNRRLVAVLQLQHSNDTAKHETRIKEGM